MNEIIHRNHFRIVIIPFTGVVTHSQPEDDDDINNVLLPFLLTDESYKSKRDRIF